VPLVHHELCFGCGRTNLFGLMLDAEPTGRDSVAGRCFIKQDHQGPTRRSAHDGIVAAALTEAMALACGEGAWAVTFEVRFTGQAPVGAFLDVEGHLEGRKGDIMHATASATADQIQIADARGTFSSATR
jgi:acyl-coenzyme A thioesterase PaaI-like protein